MDLLLKLKENISIEKKKDILEQFFNSINNDKKFKKFTKKWKLFNKEIQGRSGAEVGSLSKNEVMKVSYFENKKNKIEIENGCLLLSSHLNEILINTVLSNLNKFSNISKEDENFVDKYLLKISDTGVTDNNSFIINKKIGLNYKNNFLTNLNKIFKFNLSFLENEKEEVKKLYQKFLINNIFIPIRKILKILRKEVNFIHTDFKLNNIFVKSEKLKGYDLLRNKGFIVDFIPLISDLDKSRIKLGKTKILALSNNKYLNYIGSVLNFEPIYHIRYKCNIEYGYKKCKKIKNEDFDFLTLFINFYIVNKKAEFDILDNYFKKEFNLSMEDFINVKKIVTKSIINSERLTYNSRLIYKICKYLDSKN